jgi:hypothetical protein
MNVPEQERSRVPETARRISTSLPARPSGMRLAALDHMASIEFIRLPLSDAERTALERAAGRLPDDWQVRLATNAAPPFAIEVCVEGAGIDAVFHSRGITKTVRAGRVELLLRALEEVRSAYASVSALPSAADPRGSRGPHS